MKLFAFFLLCLLLPSVEAQPTQYRPLFAATPGWSFDGQSSGFLTGITDAEVKGFGLKVSPFRGYLKAGVFGAAKVDMNGHAAGAAAFRHPCFVRIEETRCLTCSSVSLR